MLGTDAPELILYEQVEAQMLEGIKRLEEAFADRPDTLREALIALMGKSMENYLDSREVSALNQRSSRSLALALKR